jgi:hypothetical protein
LGTSSISARDDVSGEQLERSLGKQNGEPHARTSTLDQLAGLEAWLRSLNAAGCSKSLRRSCLPLFRKGLNWNQLVRQGDTLLVTKLDR